MTTTIRIISGLLGFLFDQGKGRSAATKSIEKATIYYLWSFFIAALIGLLSASHYNRGVGSYDRYDEWYIVWFMIPFGIVLAAFHSGYRARYWKLETEKAIKKMEHYQDQLISRPAEVAPVAVRSTATYTIEATDDQLNTDARFIDWGLLKNKEGHAGDWLTWLDKFPPQTKGHAKRMRKIAEQMYKDYGGAWEDVKLMALNKQRQAK